MRTRVKICCIASVDEARAAIAAGADALGLVARMPSGPGTIEDSLIAAIAATVPPPVATLLLTCEESADAIAAHVGATGAGVVQIVSHIDARESALLAKQLPHVRRVQVIHVEDESAIGMIGRYAAHVDAFLLDSGRPGAAVAELGGTGRRHDWAISARFVAQSPVPVFLAGGLHPGNVGEAIAKVRPFGLDLCSGVRRGGALDIDLLAAFMAAVRSADRAAR